MGSDNTDALSLEQNWFTENNEDVCKVGKMKKGFGKKIALTHISHGWSVEPIWKQNPLKDQASRLNFFKELCALQARRNKGWELSTFDRGRLQLFEALTVFMETSALPLNWNCEYIQKVKNAGKTIYQSQLEDGLAGMHDPLIWSFIPRSFHPVLNLIWSGIGDWKA